MKPELIDIPIMLTFKIDVYSGNIYVDYHNKDGNDNARLLRIIGEDLSYALHLLADKIHDINHTKKE